MRLDLHAFLNHMPYLRAVEVHLGCRAMRQRRGARLVALLLSSLQKCSQLALTRAAPCQCRLGTGRLPAQRLELYTRLGVLHRRRRL